MYLCKIDCMKYGEIVYLVALNKIFMYEPAVAKQIVERFDSACHFFELFKNGCPDSINLKEKYVSLLQSEQILIESDREMEWADKNSIKVLTIKDCAYPERLKECEDAPVVIYKKGETDLNHKRIVSIVGTRMPTEYGKHACEMLIKQFALLEEKPLIVSGLAYGIDIKAHETALKMGLETIGVIATGIDQIYPAKHSGVALQICEQGAIITDFPKGTPPLKPHFLKRNRIIAGLSDAAVLIESKVRGGGMSTARMAASYFRDVFALPGRVGDERSEGCNVLINSNIAAIISEYSSVIKTLDWGGVSKKRTEIAVEALLQLEFFDENNDVTGMRKEILGYLLQCKESDISDISFALKRSVSEITLPLLELEMEGVIRQECGIYVVL